MIRSLTAPVPGLAQSVAGAGVSSGRCLQLRELIGVELQIGRCGRIPDGCAAGSAREGYDVGGQAQHPGKAYLLRAHPPSGSYISEGRLTGGNLCGVIAATERRVRQESNSAACAVPELSFTAPETG